MRKGFTLVEIIAVVVILLVITLFTTPMLKRLINNGNANERAILEERVLVAAKEYASSYDNSFYDKLVRTGDYNYIYKTDLLNSGLIDEEDISTLTNFVGVRGELLLNDNIKYTLSYIDNTINSNDYSNEELYTMLQALTNRVTSIEQNGGGGSGSGTTGNVLDAYPVGSIYLSISDTNPSALFGGAWVSFGSGKTLIGVDTNDSAFNTVEKTGGEKTHTLTVEELPSHTHSIPALSGTAASAGAHTHTRGTMEITGSFLVRKWGTGSLILSESGAFTGGSTDTACNTTAGETNDRKCNSVSFSASRTWSGSTSSSGDHTHSVATNTSTTGGSGNGGSHNILQPYITVYMWKRTA